MSARAGAARREIAPARLGVIGTVFLVLLLAGSLAFGDLRETLGGRHYTAHFSEAGGLRAGDRVIASGVAVGSVRAVRLGEGQDEVEVDFVLTDDAVTLGERTGASLVSQTVLGRRALEVLPDGSGELDGPIPLTRTTAPYDITQALAEVTRTVEDIHTDQLADAATLSAEVLRSAAPEVGPALRGMRDLSRLIAARDEELAALLRSSAGVSSLLRERSGQVQALASDGALLLAALNERSAALQQLLADSVAMADQVEGLVRDNEDVFGSVLGEVRGVLATTRRHEEDIDHALRSASPLLRELGEVVAAFPGFNVYIPNVPPTNLVPTLPQLLMGEQP